MIVDLEEATQKFEAWRKNRTTQKGKIPDELWEMAHELGGNLGYSTVAKALRLNASTLKRKAPGSPKPKKKEQRKIDLVRVAPVILSKQKQTTPMSRSSRGTMIAEIVAPSGLSIRMFSGIDPDCMKALSHLIGEA